MKITDSPTELKKSRNKELEIFTLLSHEVRTPLNAIIGISDLLQNKESEPYRDTYYRILKSTSENLLELVNNILDFSKMNSGVLEVSQRPFDLKQKIEDSLHSQKLTATSKGLEFILDFDPTIPRLVTGDQVKVAQILVNLVSNSIKFTDKGKVEISLSLKEESATSLVIEGKVLDTGIGIPAEHLDKIFDAFHQGEENINVSYAGTGLGLNITQKLVKMLKGSLEVASEQGEGTCFTVLLPFAKVAEAEQVPGNKHEFNVSALEGKKVLLAEDNKVNRLVISRYLEMWKMDYVTVGNGKDALERIKESNFDVVLMDIQMPVMDGLETLERLRSFTGSQYQNLPVIALTAAADESGTSELLYSRFDDILAKPFEGEKLSELLIAYCNLKRPI